MLKNKLADLCMLFGVSGCEDEVREYLTENIKGKAEYKTDKLGNLICFKKGKNESDKKILFTAHMDEVGFIITNITEDGYLNFESVGGIDTRVLVGKRVIVGKYKINGVIGVKPIHLTPKNERSDAIKENELYIDIGAFNRDDAQKYVSKGDYCSFFSDFVSFGQDLIKAKAIDDRFGCAALLSLIESDLEYDTYFCFTVGEEIGLRGAFVAAYNIKPDIVIAVDATTAADFGNTTEKDRVCFLNGGAVIPFMDKQTYYDKELYLSVIKQAEEKGLKWQTKTVIAGGNDAGAYQRALSGIKVLAISLPCRNIHTPSCVASLKDCENTISLLKETANMLGGLSI